MRGGRHALRRGAMVLGTLLAAGGVAAGCGDGRGGTPETTLRQGDEIPVGPGSLRVTGWEEVVRPAVPLDILFAEPGRRPVAVFLAWSGLDDLSGVDRHAFLESLLSGRARLADADGGEHRAAHAIPRALYSGRPAPYGAPGEWVVVFHPPSGAGGFRLRLRHPDPGPGEPAEVAVALY